MEPSDTIASLSQRDQLLHRAILIRESGKPHEALQIFTKVAEWDLEHESFESYIDTLGHIRISYKLLADQSGSPSEASQFHKKALEIFEKAIEASDSHKHISANTKAVLNVHLASLLLSNVQHEELKDKRIYLQRSLRSIEQALAKLPGTEAHRAWPSNTKAQILLEMGKPEEALKAIIAGENWLENGRSAEIKQGNQADIKLAVWETGLMLTKARVYFSQEKPFLAREYVQKALLRCKEHDYLANRKREALALLAEIDTKHWYLAYLDIAAIREPKTLFERDALLEKSLSAGGSQNTDLAMKLIKRVQAYDLTHGNVEGRGDTALGIGYIVNEAAHAQTFKSKTDMKRALSQLLGRIENVAHDQPIGVTEQQYLHLAKAHVLYDMGSKLSGQDEQIHLMQEALHAAHEIETPGSTELSLLHHETQARIFAALGNTRNAIDQLGFTEDALEDCTQSLENINDTERMYFSIWYTNIHSQYADIFQRENERRLAQKHRTMALLVSLPIYDASEDDTDDLRLSLTT